MCPVPPNPITAWVLGPLSVVLKGTTPVSPHFLGLFPNDLCGPPIPHPACAQFQFKLFEPHMGAQSRSPSPREEKDASSLVPDPSFIAPHGCCSQCPWASFSTLLGPSLGHRQHYSCLASNVTSLLRSLLVCPEMEGVPLFSHCNFASTF